MEIIRFSIVSGSISSSTVEETARWKCPPCADQHSRHGARVPAEHLKCGWCTGGVGFFLILT